MGSAGENIVLELEEDDLIESTPVIGKIRNFQISRVPSSSIAIASLSSSSSFSLRRASKAIFSSVNTVVFKAKMNVLIPFGPLAIFLHYLTGKHVCFIASFTTSLH